MTAALDLSPYHARVRLGLPQVLGAVTEVRGTLIEGRAAGAAVGDLFDIGGRGGTLFAEVVALRGERALMLPFGPMTGLAVGAPLRPVGQAAQVGVGPELFGRVIDALGRPLDGRPLPPLPTQTPLYASPPPLFARAPVAVPLPTGVRALDALVPLGVGQRLGIFAGPGVGKTTLMGMLARGSDADAVVMALVGERGRELGHFVDEVLGHAGRVPATIVAATSDRPASERVRAAVVATAIAERLRDEGRRVLLFVDSLTRLCMAQREIGLAIGEPPTTKGYPPSAFALLPQLLERVAPLRQGGSITGIYTVLVEGDDLTDPVADAARGLLDGHVVLSRALGLRGHFPAIDILQSLSRLEGDLLSPPALAASRRIRTWFAAADAARELVAVGAYRQGSDPELDRALVMVPKIEALLRQGQGEAVPREVSLAAVAALAQAAA